MSWRHRGELIEILVYGGWQGALMWEDASTRASAERRISNTRTHGLMDVAIAYLRVGRTFTMHIVHGLKKRVELRNTTTHTSRRPTRIISDQPVAKKKSKSELGVVDIGDEHRISGCYRDI